MQPGIGATLNPAAAERKAFARKNVFVSQSGKVTIGDEFRAELKGDGYTHGQIEAALSKVCRHIKGSDHEDWMKTVRSACAWARDDEKKLAGYAQRQPGVMRNGRSSI
jgi:hypothetical protein